MKKILITVVMIMAAVSFCYAEEAQPKATSPVGAIAETTGVIIGKFTSVIEKSLGGGKTQNSLVVAEDNGKTKMVPLDNTVTALDSAFHAVTLNQLKGKRVSVETSKDTGKGIKIQEVDSC